MVNTSGLIDELVKRMHPDSVYTCGWRYHQKWHSRPIFIQLQLLFDGKPLLYCADKLCWLSYKECLRKTPGALKSNMITMESWKKDEHYMKQGQNWKQNKRWYNVESDTDSKPTCGRPDEPLTSLKLTIIGHAPLASGAKIFFTFSPPPKHIKLVQHENVTITPHLGASTMEAQEGVAIEIAEAVVGALRGELAATAVNAPMVPAELAFPIAVLEHKYIKLICTGYLDSATEEAMEEFRRFEEEM
ncbi:D-3-phosphoglycerate dehydrogenase 1, chloroplastic-like protein [Tanacetum coccineum]